MTCTLDPLELKIMNERILETCDQLAVNSPGWGKYLNLKIIISFCGIKTDTLLLNFAQEYICLPSFAMFWYTYTLDLRDFFCHFCISVFEKKQFVENILWLQQKISNKTQCTIKIFLLILFPGS